MTCFYREPRENQNNSGNQQNVSCFNVRRVRSHKPDLLTTLPPELRLNIAERLPLPSLLSLRTVNSDMYHIIDSKMLSKAKERCVYEFQILQKPLPSENIESWLESEFQTTFHSHCEGKEINLGDLKIQNVDGVDERGAITAGRFDGGLFFVYVSAKFEIEFPHLSITFSRDNQNLYVGSSYNQIAGYIEQNRNDALANYVHWTLQNSKSYF